MTDEAVSMGKTRLAASLERIEVIFKVMLQVALTLFSPALFSLSMDMTTCFIPSDSLH